MPGVPSVYAGSEWGIEGVKAGGDDRPLRPALPSPAAAASRGRHPDLAPAIARFAAIRRGSAALRRGTYRPLHVAPEQFAFERAGEGERVVVAANAAGAPARLEIPVAARTEAGLRGPARARRGVRGARRAATDRGAAVLGPDPRRGVVRPGLAWGSRWSPCPAPPRLAAFSRSPGGAEDVGAGPSSGVLAEPPA